MKIHLKKEAGQEKIGPLTQQPPVPEPDQDDTQGDPIDQDGTGNRSQTKTQKKPEKASGKPIKAS